jgi:hypothetical protein
MRMFADDDKGVVFYETVISLKWQKHTVIECVPLPWEQFEDIPQYFKVGRLLKANFDFLTKSLVLGIDPLIGNGMVTTQKAH